MRHSYRLMFTAALILVGLVLLPLAQPAMGLPTALVQAGTASTWKVSENGAVVVYDSQLTLHTVRVDTGQTVEIDTGLYSFMDLPASYAISPNGEFVAYLKGDDNHGITLWIANTDGSAKRLVYDAGKTLLSNLDSSRFSADSAHFLFLTSSGAGNSILFSVATSGAASPIELNSPSIRTFAVATVSISPDSSTVVYTQIISPANYSLVNVYSVPIAGPGSSSVKLNLNGISTVFGSKPVIAPNSSRVAIIDGGVWSMDLGGGQRVQLGATGSIRGLQISPDSSHVVYGLEAVGPDHAEIHVVPLNGPQSADALVMWLPPSGGIDNVWFSSNGTRVLAQVGTKLYGAPVQGPVSAVVELATSVLQHFNYRAGDYAVFQDSGGYLSSVPIVGPASATQRLSIGPLSGLANPASWQLTADGQRLVYDFSSTSGQIYSVPMAGPQEATRRESIGQPDNVLIADFQLTADSRQLFFGGSGAVYVTQLGSGALLSTFYLECQSVTATPGPTPTTIPGLLPRLYLPALQRCGGIQ